MEKKKLPEIVITGTIQELVEIEPLLVMAGYDQNDKMHDSLNNNRVIAGNVVGIKCYDDGFCVYRTNAIIDVYDKRNLRASEIHKILHYIETGEIKEYCEDMQTNENVPCTNTTIPINPKYHVRDWKAVEKAFKEWADPDKSNCICYYTPTSQLEILLFFKKHFK